MTPLRIIARLQNGVIQSDPWSPSIDGILAAAMMREKLGDAFYLSRVADMQPVVGLPLDVVRHGDRWWYACSSPQLIDSHGKDRRYYHRRFDDHLEQYLPPKMGRVLTAAGPYKNTRLSETRIVCRGLEWHVIGDAEKIERLLINVDQIGAGRGRGHGVVLNWRVTDGDAERAANRPVPVEYAESIGLVGRVFPWGIVPPFRLPHLICDCVMP